MHFKSLVLDLTYDMYSSSKAELAKFDAMVKENETTMDCLVSLYIIVNLGDCKWFRQTRSE